MENLGGQPSQALVLFGMSKLFAALLLIATPAFAQQRATAYEALRVVGRELQRDYVNHVISVSGVDGTPQPETWKILVDDARARGGVREIEVRNGRVVSERTPVRSVVGTTEGATISTTHLNLDSSGAYAVASRTADQSHAPFSRVSYTLRTDERNEPIWIVTLQNESSRPVGTIYIGANKGTVTRTEGMFSGASMEHVESDRDQDRDRVRDEDEDNDDNRVKATIKGAFRRAKDEARNTFDRVKRSFVDFIDRNRD
ncbi:MAG: hypothetical protein QOI04_2065 [Verrucomicrobiota bacterium]|jgi:hypothetical protein